MNEQNTKRLMGICRKVEGNCMGTRVRRAARVVGNYYDLHLKSVGLKGTQFTLLNAIFLNPSIAITQLADLLLLNRTTLNRNLKPLERQGLIRTSPGKDQRTRILQLTQEGRRLLQKALPLWLEAQSGVVETLGVRTQRLTEDLSQLEKLEIKLESSPQLE
jgi:DNA-binding MarR family transcriptional regulator